jgi:hypothetical protein
MNKGLINSLTEAERLLVDETEPSSLATLDEDDLLDLHDRVRRARTKYSKLYRRTAGARVAEDGGRGKSYEQNQRARDKAEVFEFALARVSRQVAVVARKSSESLKRERLAAARAGSAGPASAPGAGPAASRVESTRRRATKTTGGVKKDASSRSAGARRQAKRDSR